MTKKKDLEKQINKLSADFTQERDLRLRSEDRAVILAEALLMIAETMDTLSEKYTTEGEFFGRVAVSVRNVVTKAAEEAVKDFEKTFPE